MPNISNYLAGIMSFLLGLILIYAGSPVMTFLTTNIQDTLTRLVAMLSYIIFAIICLVYVPIQTMTEQDAGGSSPQ